MKKSMIETAYQVLSDQDGALPFLDLWKQVSALMGYSQSQFEDIIGQFYSDLSMDGRFLNLPGNQWDLRSRYSSSQSNVDTDSLTLEDEEDEEEEEDQDDEAETKHED